MSANVPSNVPSNAPTTPTTPQVAAPMAAQVAPSMSDQLVNTPSNTPASGTTPDPNNSVIKPSTTSIPHPWNAAPGFINNTLRAVGNFFHYVPIANLLTDPAMNSSVKNAVVSYGKQKAAWAQANSQSINTTGKGIKPMPSMIDYLKQRNLLSMAMNTPANRTILYTDQAHMYHESGNSEGAKTFLHLAGYNPQQIQGLTDKWDMHTFMRKNGSALNKDLQTHNFDSALHLIDKSPPGIQETLGADIRKIKDAYDAGQRTQAEKLISTTLKYQASKDAIAGRKDNNAANDTTREKIATQNNAVKLLLARMTLNQKTQMMQWQKAARNKMSSIKAQKLEDNKVFQQLSAQFQNILGISGGEVDYNNIVGRLNHLHTEGFHKLDILGGAGVFRSGDNLYIAGLNLKTSVPIVDAPPDLVNAFPDQSKNYGENPVQTLPNPTNTAASGPSGNSSQQATSTTISGSGPTTPTVPKVGSAEASKAVKSVVDDLKPTPAQEADLKARLEKSIRTKKPVRAPAANGAKVLQYYQRTFPQYTFSINYVGDVAEIQVKG